MLRIGSGELFSDLHHCLYAADLDSFLTFLGSVVKDSDTDSAVKKISYFHPGPKRFPDSGFFLVLRSGFAKFRLTGFCFDIKNGFFSLTFFEWKL